MDTALLVAADLQDAFEWTSGTTYIHADLLLLDLLGKSPEDALIGGRRLREYSKYNGHTAIVVVAEHVPGNLQGTDEKVNDLDYSV